MRTSALILASIVLILSACATSPPLVFDPVCVGSGGDGRPFFQLEQTNFNVRGLPVSCDLVTFGCDGLRLVEIERLSNTGGGCSSENR